MPRDFGEGQELSPTIAEQKAAASPVDQLTGAMSGLDNKDLVASLNDIVQKANESSNAMGALDGIIRSLTADGQPLSDQFEKLVACFGQYESIVSRSASSTGSMAGGMSSLAKPVQAVADGLSKLTVEVHSLNSIASGIDLSSGFDAAIPKINAVIDRIKQLQDMTMKGVTINVNEKSSGGMKVTGDVKKEKERRSYAKGGTVHYSSRNSAIAVSGGRFVGRKDGDKEMAFVNAGEAILTERALKRGARQAGMSVGRYVNRLNSGDISEIKRGRSFAEGTSPMEPGSEKKRRAAERIQNEYNFNPIDEGKIGGYIEQGLNELGKIIKDQNKTDTQQELASWLKKAITSSRNDPMKAGALAGLFGNSGLNTKDIDTLVTRLSKGDAGDIKIFSNIKDDYEKIEKIFQGYEDKILSVGDALKKVDENGLNNFKYDMKRTFGEGFGKLITDAEGVVGKLIRTFAMLAVSVKAVGETARWFQEQASLEIGFDKAAASARVWGDVSNESFKRAADGLNLTRKEMQEFGGIMAEVGKGAMNNGDLVSAMAANMKAAFGEVDMSALKEAASIIKDLPADQAATLFGAGSFDSGANMLSNLMKGGSASFEKMADAQMKGAFGENDRMANISEADKEIIETNKEMVKLLDDMDAKMYTMSSSVGKWAQMANGVTGVVQRLGKIGGAISTIAIGGSFIWHGGVAVPVKDVGKMGGDIKQGLKNVRNSKAGKQFFRSFNQARHVFRDQGFGAGLKNVGSKLVHAKMSGGGLGAAGIGAGMTAIGAGIALGITKWIANRRENRANKKEAEIMRNNNSAINMAAFGVADMSDYRQAEEKKQIAILKESNKQMMKFGMIAGGIGGAGGAAIAALAGLTIATGGLGLAIAGAVAVGAGAGAGSYFGKKKAEKEFDRKQIWYSGDLTMDNIKDFGLKLDDEDTKEIDDRIFREKLRRAKQGGGKTGVTITETGRTNIENEYLNNEFKKKHGLDNETMQKSFEDSVNKAERNLLALNGYILKDDEGRVNVKHELKRDEKGNVIRDENGIQQFDTSYQVKEKDGTIVWKNVNEINKKMQYDLKDMAKTVKKIENIEKGVYTEYMKQTAEMHSNSMQSLSMMGGTNEAFQHHMKGGMQNVSSAWNVKIGKLQEQKSSVLNSDKPIEQKSVLLNRIMKAELEAHKEYIDGMKKFIGQVSKMPELMERRLIEATSRMFMDFQNGSFMSTSGGAMNGAMGAIDREFKNFSDISSQSSLEMAKIRDLMEKNNQISKANEAAKEQLRKINGGDYDATQYESDINFVQGIEEEIAQSIHTGSSEAADKQLEELKKLQEKDKELKDKKYKEGGTEHFQEIASQFEDAEIIVKQAISETNDAIIKAQKAGDKKSEKQFKENLKQLQVIAMNLSVDKQNANNAASDPAKRKDSEKYFSNIKHALQYAGHIATNMLDLQTRNTIIDKHEKAAGKKPGGYNDAKEKTVLYDHTQSSDRLNVAQQELINASQSKVIEEYKKTSETLAKRMNDVFHNGSIEFAKAISGALQAREKWRMAYSGKGGAEVVGESMKAQIEEASRIAEAAANAEKLADEIRSKMTEENKKIEKEINNAKKKDKNGKDTNEDKYTKEQKEYIANLQSRVDLMLQIMKNPEDTAAQKKLEDIEKAIAGFEKNPSDTNKKFLEDPFIQSTIASLGTWSESAKTMLTQTTEAMEKGIKVWEEIPKMIERALQDIQHQVDEARADAAMANVEWLNKHVDFDEAVTQGGIALKKAADSMNSGMEMIEKGHDEAMKAAVDAYEKQEKMAKEQRDKALKGANGDKAKIKKANDDFNKAIKGAAANFHVATSKADAERDRKRMAEMDKMKQRIDTVYGVKEERAGRVGKALDIQKDTLNSIGAPFEFVLQVEQNIVKLAREEAKIQEDKLAEMEAKGFKSKAIEDQKLKVAEAQAKVLKAAFGAQRDSLDKMLGKMMGTFQEVGGIFGPDGARMLAKKYGQGYSTNESGMAVQASGGPDGYAQRSYHNSAIANGFGHPLTVGDYGTGLGGQNGFNSALETANSVLRTFTQGNAKGRVGGKSTWSMSSFTDILDVFGRRFLGEDGMMENRSSDDSQLAFFKPGEKIIPEKGAAESAKQAGVPDSGLADAYRKGDLLGYMLRKSPVIGKAISVAGRAFGRSLWRIPGHLGGKVSPADAARATGSNSTVAGAPQIPQPKEGEDPVLVLVKQVDAIIKMIKSGLKVKPVKTGDRSFDTIDAELNDLKGDFAEKRARALNEAGLGKFAQLSDRQLTEVLAHKKGELDKAKKAGDEKQSNLLSTEISTIEAALSISGDLKHIEGYKANGGGEYGPANSADEEVYSSEKKGADAEKVVDSFMKDQEQLGRNIEAIKELISSIDIESIGSTIGQSIATVLQSMIQNINNSQNGGKQNAGKDDAVDGGKKEPSSTVPKQPNITGRALGGSIGANVGIVSGKRAIHMSFDKVRQFFGNTFKGENGMQHRSSVDTELALFKKGEKIIPEKGARQSAKGLGVSDYGLADAYRKGKLAEFLGNKVKSYMGHKKKVAGKSIRGFEEGGEAQAAYRGLFDSSILPNYDYSKNKDTADKRRAEAEKKANDRVTDERIRKRKMARIAWIKEHDPERYAKLNDRVTKLKAKDFVSGGTKKPNQNTKARKTSKAASSQGGKKLNLKSGSIGTVATTSSANSKPAESTPRAFWSLSDRMQNKAMNGDIPGNMSGSAGIMGYENGGSAGDYWKNTFGGFATANAANLVSDFKKAKDFVSGGTKKPSQKTVKKQNSAKPKASKLSVKPVTVKMGTTSSEARPKTESTPRAFWSLSDRMQNKAMNGDILGNSHGNIGIYGYENGGSAGGWWKDTLTSFAKRNASNFAGDVSRIGEIGRDVFGKVAGIFGHGPKSNSTAAGSPQTKPAGQNPKTYASLSMLGSGDSSLTLESFNPMETQGHFDGLVRGFDKGGEAGDNGDDMFVVGTMDSSHEERERERDEGVVEEEENMKKAEEEARIKRKEAAEKHASKSAEHFKNTYSNYQLGKIAWLKKNDPERYAKLNEQAKRLKDADGNNYKSYKDWYKRTQLTDEKINEQAEKIYNDEMKQHERDELVRQGIDPDTGKPYVRRYENGLVTQGQLYTSEYELNRAQDNFVFLKYGFNSASAYKQYQKSLKDKTFKKPQTRDEMAQLKGYKSYGDMIKRYDKYAKEQGYKNYNDMLVQKKRERENEAKKAAGEAFLNNIRKMRENQIQPTNLTRSQKVEYCLSKLDVSRMEKNIDENLNEIGNILNYKRNTGTLSFKMPAQNVFRPPRNPNTPLTPAQLTMLGMNKNRRGKIRTTEEGAKYLILNYGFDLDDFAIVDDDYVSVPVPAHENGSAGIMGYENGGSVGDYWKNTLGNFAKTNAGNFVGDMKTAGTTVMRGASGVIGTFASVKKPNAQAGGKPASKAGKKAPAQTKAALDRRSLMDNSIMLDSFNAGASTKGNENGSPGFGISRNTVDGKNSLNARRSDIIGWLGGSPNSEDNQIALFKRNEKVIPADKAKESADKLEVSDYGLADAYRKGVLGEFLGSNGIFADSSEKVESYENGKAGDDRNKQNGRSSSDMNGLNPSQTIYMPANITQAADYAGVNANPETLSPTMAGGMAGVMMSMLNGGNGGGAAAGQQAGDMNMGTVDMTGSMDSGSYTVRFLVKMDPESLKGALSGETEKNIVSALKNGRTANHF